MTSRDKFLPNESADVIPELIGSPDPLMTLVRSQGLNPPLGAITRAFENGLATIFATALTGLDHSNQRVPLFLGKGPGPHDFFVATTPEGDPRTPQRRNEYTLEVLPDNNLIARRTKMDGIKTAQTEILGQGKFDDVGAEINDVFVAVLGDIRKTFQPAEKKSSGGSAPSGP